MTQPDRQLHRTSGGEVFGPPAPAASLADEPAPSPRSPLGPGGGSADSVMGALGHYAELASPHPHRHPRAPRASLGGPPGRTLTASNIARRDNSAEVLDTTRIPSAGYEPADGWVAEPATPPVGEPLPAASLPRPGTPAGRAPATRATPLRPGMRSLAASNIARRDNFRESLTVDRNALDGGFERTEDYVEPAPEPAPTHAPTVDPRFR